MTSNSTTYETITVTDPGGHEMDVSLKLHWGPFEVNPCDKTPNQYRGEDDGCVLEAVEVMA